jgi:hypothetical protein
MRASAYPILILVFSLGFAVNAAARAQVQPTAQGGPDPDNGAQMMTPSLLTGVPYPNQAGADERQNYLTAAVASEAAYIDNVLPGSTAVPVGDATISIVPSIALDKSTSRQHEAFLYSPSFTFYTPTSQLNSINHSANGVFRDRLTQRISLDLSDTFVRTSNVFESSYPFSGGLNGTTQPPVAAAIAPFAEQLTNNANAALTYQFSRDGMIGGGATFSEFRLPDSNRVTGLYNSDGNGGSAFYARRFSQKQYLGLRYEYDRNLTYLPGSQFETQTQTPMAFYSVFFSRTFSLSAAAGPTFVSIAQPQQPTTNALSPSVVLGMGWQGQRSNLTVGFLRTVISGGGLLGGDNSVGADVSGGWKLSRSWNAVVSFNYAKIEPIQASGLPVYQGGNSIAAQGTLGRAFGEHIAMQFGYQRLHGDFTGIQAIIADPDTDRGFVNVSYNFKKSLGK